MRATTIHAASFAAIALAFACSDGSELVPKDTSSASSSSTAGASATPNAGSGGADLPAGGSSSSSAGTVGMPSAGGSPVGTAGSIGTAGSVGTAGSTGTAGGAGGAAATGGTANGGSAGAATDPYSGPFKILVLDTTLDFPHDSIPICDLMVGLESNRAAVEADRQKSFNNPNFHEPPNLGATPDAMMPPGTKPGSQWTADHASDDLAQFTEAGLKQYALVFSCNPTGTVFSNNAKVKDKAAVMAAFQKFVEGGGAWAGVHSATDFEKNNGFPWFTNLLAGAYFDHHDNDGTPGTVQVVSTFSKHVVMAGVPPTWSSQDEWYYMNRDVSNQPGFQILARLASDNRPVVWIKELGSNGRMFYTIRGHNKTRYEETEFRRLVLNGILWATHRLN